MKIEVILKNNKTGEMKKGHYTSRQLLEKDEETLFAELSACDCESVGETNVAECSCEDNWEDCELFIGTEIENKVEQIIRSLSEKERRALESATSAIYFNDSSDYLGALREVVNVILGSEFDVEIIYNILREPQEGEEGR